MKKLFFTAIALVAFSGVSMANTNIITDSVKLVTMDKLQTTAMQEIDATVGIYGSVYLAAYQAAVDNGANDQQAAATAWQTYLGCKAAEASIQQ